MVIDPVPSQFPQPLPSQSPQMEVMSCMRPTYDGRLPGANHDAITPQRAECRYTHSATADQHISLERYE